MRIAIVLFDEFVALDAIGPYEMLRRLPNTETVFVAEHAGPVRDAEGALSVTADAALTDVPRPDVVVVPGGAGQAAHMSGSPLLDWLRDADSASTWTTSVCTGSLLLAAAGLLRGRRATSYWLALAELAAWGVTVVRERVVFDGKYVTAAGVSSGIDMGLALAERVAGTETAQRIQLGTEYDPRPPHDTGAPHKAPSAMVESLRRDSRFVQHRCP